MRKEITIGGKPVTVLADGVTPVIYRQVFKQDLLVFLQEFNKRLRKKDPLPDGTSDMLGQLAFVMNAQAERGTKNCYNRLTMEEYIEFLMQFDPLDIELASDGIISAYYDTEKTTSKSKNA